MARQPRLACSARGESSPQGNRRFTPASSLDESDDSPAAATSHSSSVGSLRPAQLQNASASHQFTCSTGRCASSGTHWSKFRRSQRPAASRFQYTGCPALTLSRQPQPASLQDRKSTRLNSSHSQISYAVFCLKKKTANVLIDEAPDRLHTRPSH